MHVESREVLYMIFMPYLQRFEGDFAG